MGRPPRGGPSAVERLESAFFRELNDTPFQELTISGIVASAGVNRNSFYYHYSNLDDLAHSAVESLLLSEIPALIAGGLSPDSEEFGEVLAGAIDEHWFTRVLAITGPNSTSELRDILKDSVANIWLEAFGLEHSDLQPPELSTMEFCLGGSLELLTKVTAGDMRSDAEVPTLIEALAEMRRLPILQASGRAIVDALSAAAERVRSRAPR